MPDTITESELTAMKNKFIADSKYPYATPDAMRYALKHVGITVIPDPIPEPVGDVIVVDRFGRKFAKDRGPQLWACSDSTGVMVINWARVLNFGPVKIYRAEERP